MVIKVCLSIFCYDRNIDRMITTCTDHIKIMSYRGLKIRACIMLVVSIHCFYILHKGAYKVHLISGSIILQIAVAIILV